ncbi:MAG: hypothetical protein A2015_05705 [Spirochaetes bacterium GWF1_31_7]|nr:MAG: hypothetical protein A2Y30_00115 [Spirochaetes bacterium GWE1_32_154]OHD47187.1 MAG: hypothetical protein A2Y29_10700 [Spirochaetes bacterium GWE2_31_10]OHD48920.1 MAG: hypothetical protein A2015_05705 [Spirochaetes bacterium GWF1_31_7]OHD76561.1 MAG: hypothetical protein A2355_15465 [Spirochaetes bacterium RIFOXYB1_FULL_32_8]HBD92630.1 hypothetical protein [Spirochaetia bacterium]
MGFQDISVSLAYILSVLITIVCAVYGIIHWNHEGDVSAKELEEEKQWIKEEIQIDDDLSNGGKA